MRHSARYVKDRLTDRGVSLQDIADRSVESLREVQRVVGGTSKNRAIVNELSKATGVPVGYIRDMYDGRAA